LPSWKIRNHSPRFYIEALAALGGLFLLARFFLTINSHHYFLSELLTPTAGEQQALPSVVTEGLALTRRHKLQRIQIDSDLLDDPLTRERFIEGLYPVRIQTNSNFALVTVTDSAPGCTVVERASKIMLVKCDQE
jgi:hypothetical protein